MKKIMAVVFLVSIMGFPLYAQLGPGIGVAGWARYVIAPGVAGKFDDTMTDESWYFKNQSNQNWLFPTKGKVGLATWGTSDYVGFNFDVCLVETGLVVGDQAKLWVRPHDTLVLQFGRIEGNELRSGIIGGRLTYTEEENDIFTRFNPLAGILIDWKPIENLYIGASIDVNFNNGRLYTFKQAFGWDAVMDDGVTELANGYQLGAGYQFDFGFLRAQFLPNNGGVWSGRPIQAAFAFTKVYNLVAEAGFLYPLKPLKNSPAHGTLAATYKFDQWDFMGRATLVWYPESIDAGTRTKLGGVVKYTINFPLFVGGEFAYLSDYQPYVQQSDNLLPLKKGEDIAQICPFVGFKFSRGEFRVGVHWEQNFIGDTKHYKLEFPLMLEANFF